jgi:uncharacterized membrane protein
MDCAGIDCLIPPGSTAQGWSVEGVVAALFAFGVVLLIQAVIWMVRGR